MKLTNGSTLFRVGETVQLVTPGNLRLDGSEAVVTVLEPWGAHVKSPAAATGQFRAAWHEMRPLPQPTGHICDNCGGSRLIRTGVCHTCLDCGTTGGCS